MRQRCTPQPGTLAAKDLTFRPADPVWANLAALATARAVLKAYDPYLDLWWSPLRGRGKPGPVGRWRIVAYRAIERSRETVMFWEGPDGEYRGEFPKDALLAEVHKRDMWAKGTDFGREVERLDRDNAALKAAQREEHRAESWRYAHDKTPYDVGAKFNVDMKAKERRSRERKRVPRRAG